MKCIPSYAFLFTWTPGHFSSHSPALSDDSLSCITCKEKFLASSSQEKLHLGILVKGSMREEKVLMWVSPIFSSLSSWALLSFDKDKQKGKEVQLTLRVFFLTKELTK